MDFNILSCPLNGWLTWSSVPVAQEVYGLLMQRSIVKAASTAIESSDKRQQEARREREAEAAAARESLKQVRRLGSYTR